MIRITRKNDMEAKNSRMSRVKKVKGNNTQDTEAI